MTDVIQVMDYEGAGDFVVYRLPHIPRNHTVTLNISTGADGAGEGPQPVVATVYVVLFSTLFCAVGLVGVVGNFMVMWIVVTDRKMRKSVTNMLILNLAVADALIMLFGVPEILLFMMNRGWLLGLVMCKVERTILVCSLYSSVLTLVTVCIERYIAIVFPIQAHLVCTKRRVFAAIVIIWMASAICSVPTSLFNTVAPPVPGAAISFCMIIFPGNGTGYMTAFKYCESSIFYIGPLVLQLVCYSVIVKKLFVGVEKLHRNNMVTRYRATSGRERTSEAIRARKGVVKMLIASVIIYFLSYSPHQVLLFYNTFSSVRFDESWMFLVLSTILAYINSAANPILYCVFSENFRTQFQLLVHRLRCCSKSRPHHLRANSMTSFTEYTSFFKRSVIKGPKLAQPTAV